MTSKYRLVVLRLAVYAAVLVNASISVVLGLCARVMGCTQPKHDADG